MAEATITRCSCASVLAEDGSVSPAGWVCLHEEVRLVRTGGFAVSGTSYGPEWIINSDGRATTALIVEPEDGDPVGVHMNEVVTLTPLGDRSDVAAAIGRVTDLVRRAGDLAANEDHYVPLILDAHTTVEVTVRKTTHPCKPGSHPA